jgi:hypothetical protein
MYKIGFLLTEYQPMKIKIKAFVLPLLACTVFPVSQVNAATGTSPAEISKQILHVVKNYATSTSCGTSFEATDPSDPSRTSKKDIVALTPLGAGADSDSMYDPVWQSQEYAVLWYGNCAGGNGTDLPTISIVKGNLGHIFTVNPAEDITDVQSSAAGAVTLVGAAPNKIIYKSERYSNTDSQSCASQVFQYTIDRNAKGVWKQTASKFLGLSDCGKQLRQ